MFRSSFVLPFVIVLGIASRMFGADFSEPFAIETPSCPDLSIYSISPERYVVCQSSIVPYSTTFFRNGPARSIEDIDREINVNLQAFGAYFQDIVNSNNEDCFNLAKDKLCYKIKSALESPPTAPPVLSDGNVPDSCMVGGQDGQPYPPLPPFQGWLEGAYVEVIMPALLALGAHGKMYPALEHYGRRVAYDYLLDLVFDEKKGACYRTYDIGGNKGCWDCCDFDPVDPNSFGGDTCLDDFSTSAAGYAWVAAFEALSGRVFSGNIYNQKKADAMSAIEKSFHTQKSICVRDHDSSYEHAECSHVTDLDSILPKLNTFAHGDEYQAMVMNFNHAYRSDNWEGKTVAFENPTYGIGLMSTMSAAYQGLESAGITPPPASDLRKLLAQQLLYEGQVRCDLNGDNYYPGQCYWWKDKLSETYEDADCWDPTIGEWGDDNDDKKHYRPRQFPVSTFYDKYFSPADRTYHDSTGTEYTLPELTGYGFNRFANADFDPQDNFFHSGRVSILRDLGWCWYWPKGSVGAGLPVDCQYQGIDAGRPALVGPPSMWTDVPPATADGTPVNICQDSLFFGWVFTDAKAGGTDIASRRALIVDADQSCLTVDYPTSGYLIPNFGAKRSDVCQAYRNAFEDQAFYRDPVCQPDGTEQLGWDVPYAKGLAGSYKLLVWYKDQLGNLKCSERAFNVVDNCYSAPPTSFIYLEPLNGAMLYDTSATLRWLPSANANRYDVYFGLSPNPSQHELGIVGTELAVTVEPGKTYYWRIIAKGQGGDSVGQVWNFSAAATCAAPQAPTVLQLAVDPEPCAATGIKVTWPIFAEAWNDACTSNCSTRRYQVLRNGVVVHSEYGPWGSAGFTEGTPILSRMWHDTTAVPNINYTYKVRYINQCGLAGNTNSVTAADHAYAPIIPEILSPGSNTCPAQTVRLTASSGSGQFQWYLDNNAIPGAISSYYDASQSGAYSVGCVDAHYCNVLSPAQYVEVQACPAVQFTSAQALSQVAGDGDDIMEAGERWQITIALANTGNADATNVMATLEGEGAIVFYNPLRFGNIAAQGSRQVTVEFALDPVYYFSQKACGQANNLQLGLNDIQSDYGSILYGDLPSVISATVGRVELRDDAQAQTFGLGIGSPMADSRDILPKLLRLTAQQAGAHFQLSGGAESCCIVKLVKPDSSSVILKSGGSMNSSHLYDVDITGEYAGPGFYKISLLKQTGCNQAVSISDIRMFVIEQPRNCDIVHDAVLKLDQVSTAGGTIVSLSGAPGRFTGITSVNVGIAGVGGECSSLRASTAISVNPEGTLLTFTAPAAAEDSTPEGGESARLADVQLVKDTASTCLPGVLKLVPLAYTSNQITGDISVIDTIAQARFASMPSMPLLDGTLPFGIALGRGAKAGRELYVVDYATGNLQIYDAVNFQYRSTITLQDPDSWYVGNGAIDLAVSADGTRAYVIHLTDGLPYISTGNPGYGGISVVDLENRVLLDADPAPDTWSSGAPMGYNRITTDLYPYSISNLLLERNVDNYMVDDGWPGEYAFVSGVGPAPYLPGRWRCACIKTRPPYRPCLYPCDNTCKSQLGELRVCWIENYGSRPLKVGVLNLNSQYVSALDPLTPSDYVQDDPNDQVYEAYLGSQWIGTDGRVLGNSNQGLDFSLLSVGREHPEDARILAVSPEEDRVYAFDFTEATRIPLDFAFTALPLSCVDAVGNPITCRPLDIKVQTISLAGTPTPLAFTANADAASLSILDPTAIALYGDPIPENMCHAHQYPVSLDIRSDGMWGYVANYSTDTLLALNFNQYLNGDASCASYASIPVGMMPVRVVVQEVPSSEGFAAKVSAALNYALATSFDQPAQQETLIRSWESIRELQETSASPQAILAHLDNFQRNATQWITGAAVSATVDEGVDLYRAAYLQENDLPGNP